MYKYTHTHIYIHKCAYNYAKYTYICIKYYINIFMINIKYLKREIKIIEILKVSGLTVIRHKGTFWVDDTVLHLVLEGYKGLYVGKYQTIQLLYTSLYYL